MSSRKSPTQSATTYKVGTIKKGLDGNMWEIKETENQVKRWVKVNKSNSKKQSKIKGKKYLVHDNGGKPFQVVINKNKVSIFKQSNQESDVYDKLVKNYTVKKVHIGKDKDHKQPKFSNGNTILLEFPNNKFIFVGESIFEFELAKDDEFQKYFSELGNSDVPYPVLLGKNNFYSMAEKEYCSRDEFPSTYKVTDFKNAHDYYYWGSKDEQKANEKKNIFKKPSSHIKNIKKLPKMKIIHKRLW